MKKGERKNKTLTIQRNDTEGDQRPRAPERDPFLPGDNSGSPGTN